MKQIGNRGLAMLGLPLALSAVFAVAEDPLPQSLQYNVLLSDWQVLGPFAKPDESDSGLDVDIVSNEAALVPGGSVERQRKTYQWQPWHRRTVDFHRALQAWGADGNHAVAYAWTQFASDSDTPAVLSVGHDDSVAVWFNGEAIYRDDKFTACYLDQSRLPVTLRQGTNTLLLKVGQGTHDWEAIARVLPAGLEEPLVSIRGKRRVDGDLSRVPLLRLELVDDGGDQIGTLKASGFRRRSPGGLWFTAYGDIPAKETASVRVICSEQHFEAIDARFPWTDVQSGKAAISLKADRHFLGQIVDAATKQPIPNAQIWHSGIAESRTLGEEARVDLTNFNPLATRLWVAAPGYEADQYQVAWPWSEQHTIELRPGGKVLSGTVTTKDGKPLSGVSVAVRLAEGSPPKFTTDADGHFAVVGIAADKTRLLPVVTKPDYVAKGRFAQQLQAPVTEVAWQLERGAVAHGTVVSTATGRPVEGVTVTAGFDRFGSNSEQTKTTTDAHGSFTLTGIPPGQTMLHAFSDHHAPAMHSFTATIDEATSIDFELEDGQPVTGRIVDPHGDPVDDVWVITDTWNGARMFRRETRSAADGTFTLSHMPDPPTEVHVIKRGYVSQRDLMAQAGQHYEIAMAPVVEHRIRIRLADSDGPLADLQIQKGYQWSGRDQLHWDARDGSPRDYDAATGMFTIRNSETANAKVLWRFRYPGYLDAVIEEPDSNSETQPLEVVLKPAASVTGKVVSAETGKPLKGIGVAVVNKSDRLRPDHYVQFHDPWPVFRDDFTGLKDVTIDDGSFSLPQHGFIEGNDLVLIAAEGGFHYFPDAKSWLAEDGSLQLPFAEHGFIEGQVTVAGEPVAGEVIHAGWNASLNPGENAYDIPFGVGGQITCDEEGRYRFPALGAGRYRISRIRGFDQPGGGGLSMYMSGDDVVLLPGQTLVHNIERPAGRTVTGQTVDPQGEPLPGCIIEVTISDDRGQRIDAVRADSQGCFTIEHLPEEGLDLAATHYTPRDGQMCGLGGEDFRGRRTVSPREAARVVINLTAVHGNSLTNAVKLAGSVPPDFTATPLDAPEPFTLSDNWGKVVAIDFWATWCGPCMSVMPEMIALHEKYKNQDEVIFITVSLDEDEERLREELQEKGLEFPVVFSNRGWDDPISRAFGVTGVPSSFVIGRDGRFAAERIHGSQLAAAVEVALERPIDPLYTSGVTPARLTIQLQLDETELGIPGATLKLKAIDATGNVVREDDLVVPGLAPQLVWLYPQVTDGSVVAEVSADGFPTQNRTVASPTANEEVTFSFSAPRQIAGVVELGDGTGVGGIEITVRGPSGFTKSVTSDTDGSFAISVLPGQYRHSVTGTDQYAPVATTDTTVNVASDSDPTPISVEVCRAITLNGIVVDEDGSPAADAQVQAVANREGTTTDAEGHFQLAGVPSVGESMIFASLNRINGAVRIADPSAQEPVTITLGIRPDRSAGFHRGVSFPTVTVMSLEGSPVSWSPTADTDRLLVFCELAHPASRAFIEQSIAWADDREIPVEIFSIDWGSGIANRVLDAFTPKAVIYWLGPSALSLDDRWQIERPTQAVVVSAQGKIVELPVLDGDPLESGG